MRIAVPTDDGVSIAQHFGRAAAFLVFEIEGGQITDRQMRPNQGEECHNGGAGGEHVCGAQGHGGIVERIGDCQMVLCGGMGQRAANALQVNGISPVVVQPVGSAEETVAAFLAGKVTPLSGSLCSCHH